VGPQAFPRILQRKAWKMQIFPRIALVVLCIFKALQGKKENKWILQIFRFQPGRERRNSFPALRR
jgi:hypothetical protein